MCLRLTIPATLRLGKTLLFFLWVTAWEGASLAGPPAGRAAPGERGLSISPVVVCRSIEGYERYERLRDATMTSDEKLLVYYKPAGYQVQLVNGVNQAHFTVNGQIRRREDKAIIWQKVKLPEFKLKDVDPSKVLYLTNSISVKGLMPGEYEFVLNLHDEVGKGPPAKQIVRFRIVAPKLPTQTDGEPTAKSDTPAPAALPKR
jgi:hypothetical protein